MEMQQGQFIRAASGGKDMGTIQEHAMMPYFSQRSGNLEGLCGGPSHGGTPHSMQRLAPSPTAARHLQVC